MPRTTGSGEDADVRIGLGRDPAGGEDHGDHEEPRQGDQ
jgi:hypothetical protein